MKSLKSIRQLVRDTLHRFVLPLGPPAELYWRWRLGMECKRRGVTHIHPTLSSDADIGTAWGRAMIVRGIFKCLRDLEYAKEIPDDEFF